PEEFRRGALSVYNGIEFRVIVGTRRTSDARASFRSVLLTREEMTFDFRGARLDPARDRKLLGWMMNQFLYGEVTGIQCGHWLYGAPDLEAARFFSKQAVEEF